MRMLFSAVFLTLAMLAFGGCSHGADQAKKDEDKHATKSPGGKHKKVKVHIHHEVEQFDLAKVEERKKFIEHIDNGDVDEIEVEKNPMDIYADLGLWSIVVFVGLMFILRKFAWGPMLEGLTKREQSIRSSVEEAQLAREETERLRAQFKAEMDQAFAKIPQLMEDARKQADKLAEEIRAKASAEIQSERDRLRREMQMQQDQALKALWDKTAELATLISGRVLARSLTPEDHQRLFRLATEEMQSSGRHDDFVNA